LEVGSEFLAEVFDVVRGEGLVQEFLYERKEVMKRADWVEWRVRGITQQAPRSG